MKLFALSLAFTLATAVGNSQTYDTSADFGTFNPAASITTPAYTLNGNTVVLKVLCGAIRFPVTAVFFGSQALTRATQVSNPNLGTVDVWYLVGATAGSAPFTITTDGTSHISVQAYSAANVSALSGTPVTNTTNRQCSALNPSDRERRQFAGPALERHRPLPFKRQYPPNGSR